MNIAHYGVQMVNDMVQSADDRDDIVASLWHAVIDYTVDCRRPTGLVFLFPTCGGRNIKTRYIYVADLVI